MFSYNTSVHEGTKYIPHELVFGRLVRASIDSVYNDLHDEKYAHYLADLIGQLEKSQEAAKVNLDDAKVRSKKHYNKKQKTVSFAAGDSVYFLKGKIKRKLDDQYEGPYRITQVLDRNNVRIETNTGPRVVHTDRLKLYKARRLGNLPSGLCITDKLYWPRSIALA